MIKKKYKKMSSQDPKNTLIKLLLGGKIPNEMAEQMLALLQQKQKSSNSSSPENEKPNKQEKKETFFKDKNIRDGEQLHLHGGLILGLNEGHLQIGKKHFDTTGFKGCFEFDTEETDAYFFVNGKVQNMPWNEKHEDENLEVTIRFVLYGANKEYSQIYLQYHDGVHQYVNINLD